MNRERALRRSIQRRLRHTLAVGGALGLGLTAASTVVSSESAIAQPPRPSDATVACPVESPYSMTQAQLAACHISVFPLASKTDPPNGGTTYTYHMGTNTATFRVPPPGFNPLTASNVELEYYGLPPRPSPLDVDAFRTWVADYAGVHFEAPPPFLAEVPVDKAAFTPRTGGEQSRTLAFSGCVSCWAGYVDQHASHNNYTVASVQFTEPRIGPSRCSNDGEFIWGGIGGYGVQQLGQDGTAWGSTGIGDHQAWTEVLPDQPGVVPVNLFATPGGSFLATTIWQGDIGYKQYDWNLVNEATKRGISFFTSSTSYNGSTVEAIVERPMGDNLANFGTIPFTKVQEEIGSGNLTAFSNSAFPMNIYNSTGSKQLDSLSPLSNYKNEYSDFSIRQTSCN